MILKEKEKTVIQDLQTQEKSCVVPDYTEGRAEAL